MARPALAVAAIMAHCSVVNHTALGLGLELGFRDWDWGWGWGLEIGIGVGVGVGVGVGAGLGVRGGRHGSHSTLNPRSPTVNRYPAAASL